MNQLFIVYSVGQKIFKFDLVFSVLCDHLEGWDREGGRETQEGGNMGINVYV